MVPMFLRHVRDELWDNRDVILWVWRSLMSRKAKRQALIYAIAMFSMLALYMVQPIIFAKVVNGLEDEARTQVFVAICAMILLWFFRSGIDLVAKLVRECVWNQNTLVIKDRINELFHEKTLGQHVEESSSLNYANVEKGTNRTDQLQGLILMDASVHIPALFVAYALLWSFGLVVGLMATVVVGVHFAWSLYINYRCSIDLKPVEEGFRSHNRQFVERMEKIVRVKTSAKSAAERERLREEHGETLALDKRFFFWFHRQGTYRELVAMLLRMGIVGYGAYLVYAYSHPVGYLIPLYTWVREIGGSLMNLGRIERQVSDHMPYVKTLRDVLTMPPPFREDEGVPLPPDRPIRMRFDNVSFSFGHGHVLKDVNLSIDAGEKVAIIGPSGAGKSSLMKLALRFMDPTDGEIWIDGMRLRDIQQVSWLQRVGYIPQSPYILDGTIWYNLTFALSEERRATITTEEVRDVMRRLRIDVGGRPPDVDILDVRVGRNGVRLSGGEAQRLMIGAAVIKEPDFMIIDEATSSLDSSTERAVQQGLEMALAGSTGALIIAHRLSTVRHMCDRFVVLRPIGDVPDGESQVEAIASSFEELSEVSPTFRQLAGDQEVALV